MKPRLMAISGSLRGTVRPLVDGQISIGRGDSNHVCLMDRSVSRRHCTIEQVDERFELADLDSHNGTFVNGIPVRRKVVGHGDTLRVGHSEFVFLLHEGDDSDITELRLSDEPSISELETIRVDQPAPLPHFGVEVGRMARDLAALFRISDFINSIRDIELLQRELLRLIFEVIPADNGAIVLLASLDEEPTSICSWARRSGDPPSIKLQRELVRRAIWEQSAVFTNGTKESSDAPNVLCLPLIGVEKTLGVIYLTSSGDASPFREDHIHFLSRVSRIAAVTLENILALDALSSENQRLKEELSSASQLVGESRQIGQVEEFIRRVAHGDSTVLIRGESGTGKELIARALHHSSPRAARPFIAINCAAIPEALLESELFGHEKGAFTGAVGTKKGKLEAAEDGTVFFDEIGELAPLLQAKLLTSLCSKGSSNGLAALAPSPSRPACWRRPIRILSRPSSPVSFDRICITASMWYRSPCLRCGSIATTFRLLALYFAAKYAAQSKRPFKGISREARMLLMNYSWPGNVRELENAIEHAIVLGLTEEILPEDLPTAILEEQSAAVEGARYHSVLNQAKKELILTALREASGSYPEAARLLGIHPKYLHRLARSLNLKAELR